MRGLNKAAWLARRLVAMPPVELLHRARQAGPERWRRRLAAASRTPPRQAAIRRFQALADGGTALDRLRALRALLLPVDPRAAVLPPSWRPAAVAGANRILGGEIDLFDGAVTLASPIDWHVDPQTGKGWPREFSGRLDYRQPIGASAKRIWELNRHTHLTQLARAYAWTGEPAYGREVVARCLSWIDQNPQDVGINWTSELELALRVANWTWSLALIGDLPELKEEEAAAILGAAALQVEHVARNPSLFSSANNHLIGELLGIWFFTSLVPGLPRLRPLGRWAGRGLERELLKQTHEDGVTKEQAFDYGRCVFEFYVHLLAAQRRLRSHRGAPRGRAGGPGAPHESDGNRAQPSDSWPRTQAKIGQAPAEADTPGVPAANSARGMEDASAAETQRPTGQSMPPECVERMAAIARFVLAARDGRGSLPPIGDSDEAILVPLCDAQSERWTELLAGFAAVTDRPDLWPPEHADSELAWWLTGSAARPEPPAAEPAIAEPVEADAAVSQPPATAGRPSVLFPRGGYAVMRHGEGDAERILFFDVGPLGYGGIAAHGHADALALHLSAAGQPLLRDPGTYCYHERPEWRDYFRSTRAHNTVVVDGADQSEMWGAFLWGRRAKATLSAWHTNPQMDYADARHDGYARGPAPVIHRRRVLFLKPDVWIVIDTLEGSGSHSLEQWWHLADPGDLDPETAVACARTPDHRLQLTLVPATQSASTQAPLSPPSRLPVNPPSGAPITQPLQHPATQSPSHAITQSPSHPITPSTLPAVSPPSTLPRAIRMLGQESPLQGWHSDRFGAIRPAPAICYRLTGEHLPPLVTVLALGPPGEPAPHAAWAPEPGGLTVHLRLGDTEVDARVLD